MRKNLFSLISWQPLVSAALIIGACLARLVDHWPNVSPVAAVALLAGATLAMPWSLLVPLSAMFISDSIIGFDAWQISLSVYVSFALTVGIGTWLKRSTPSRIIGASLISSLLFYLVTNAAVWWWGQMYVRSLDGLLLAYFYGIPFLRNTLLGDLAYTGSLFLAAQYVPVTLRSLFAKKISLTAAPSLVKK